MPASAVASSTPRANLSAAGSPLEAPARRGARAM